MIIYQFQPGDSTSYRLVAEVVGSQLFFAFGIGQTHLAAMTFPLDGDPDWYYVEEKLGHAIGRNLHARRVAYIVLRYLLTGSATPFMPNELEDDPTTRFCAAWEDQLPTPIPFRQGAPADLIV